MRAMDAFVEIVNSSGESKSGLARKLGRGHRYLLNTLSRGSLPRVDNFSMIADACGYDLLLRKRSDNSEILIDPPDDQPDD